MNEKWKSIGRGTVVAEKYQLMRELEPGGGGPVFAAVRKKTKKIVIVRFFSEAVIPNMKAFNRAMRNAKAAFDKRNEFVTIPFDYEFHEGVPYVVYSGAAIKTLHQLLMGGKKFTRKETKKLGQMLLSPLSTLHKAGIFHLGLSPMSIHQKKSKAQAFDLGVLDFGVTQTRGHDYFTRLADDEQYRCIAAYAAPEQAAGDVEADHRADLYAVGALVYRLLLGREPFDGKDSGEILKKVKSEKPAGLGEGDGDGDLTVLQKEFLSRCLEKDPAGRFQTALEMRESFFNAMFEEDDSFPSTERKKIVKSGGRSPMVFYKVSDDQADRMEASTDVPTRELSVEPILQMAKVAAAFEKQVPSEQDREKEAGKQKPIDHKKRVSLPPPPTDREMPSIPPPPLRTSRERILELAKLARETASAKAAASAARLSELEADALENEGERLIAESGLGDKKEEAPPERKETAPEKEEEAADRDEAAPEGEENKGEPEAEKKPGEEEEEEAREEEEEEEDAADGQEPGDEPERPSVSRKEAATIPATSPADSSYASLEPQGKESPGEREEKKKGYLWIIIIAIVLAAIAAVALVFALTGNAGEDRGENNRETGHAAQEPEPQDEPEPGGAETERQKASPSAQESNSAKANPAGEEAAEGEEKTGQGTTSGATPPDDATDDKKTRKKGPTEDLEFVD
ncbi:MAG: hypothetical protein ABIJ56_22605 [Pseudomonadota bacterium]